MKRCPTCNLVETDDSLRFCRADGTTLIRYSGPIGATNEGIVRFDSGAMRFKEMLKRRTCRNEV